MLYVYSSSYTIFRTLHFGKKYIYLNRCVCIYNNTKCLQPSLLDDIHLIINIGGCAAETPGKRYLILNFISLACSDENIFGNVHQQQIKYILNLQCLNQQYYFFCYKVLL